MEEFEGRADADAISFLLQSSAAAHMNTIRIWGGGVSSFYLFLFSFPILFPLFHIFIF